MKRIHEYNMRLVDIVDPMHGIVFHVAESGNEFVDYVFHIGVIGYVELFGKQAAIFDIDGNLFQIPNKTQGL